MLCPPSSEVSAHFTPCHGFFLFPFTKSFLLSLQLPSLPCFLLVEKLNNIVYSFMLYLSVSVIFFLLNHACRISNLSNASLAVPHGDPGPSVNNNSVIFFWCFFLMVTGDHLTQHRNAPTPVCLCTTTKLISGIDSEC